MIIYFMQKWPNGEQTNFKEKIMTSLKDKVEVFYNLGLGILNGKIKDLTYIPKYHTLRESTRVKKGMMLDLAYWSGVPYRSSPERFVLQTPCTNTQSVLINPEERKVYVDGKLLGDSKLQRFVLNDGFENVDKFFLHFNKRNVYHLIHWGGVIY